MGGAVSYHAGLAAEGQVADHYCARGHDVAARRWRGLGGELDLILRRGAEIVFVEVKRAKRHDWALERVTTRQIQRIFDAAGEFLGGEPGGLNTSMRFDVATVDGRGEIRILENAFL